MVRVCGNWQGPALSPTQQASLAESQSNEQSYPQNKGRPGGSPSVGPRSFRKTRQCLRALFLPSLHRSNSLHAEITRKSIGAVKFVEKNRLAARDIRLLVFDHDLHRLTLIGSWCFQFRDEDGGLRDELGYACPAGAGPGSGADDFRKGMREALPPPRWLAKCFEFSSPELDDLACCPLYWRRFL